MIPTRLCEPTHKPKPPSTDLLLLPMLHAIINFNPNKPMKSSLRRRRRSSSSTLNALRFIAFFHISFSWKIKNLKSKSNEFAIWHRIVLWKSFPRWFEIVSFLHVVNWFLSWRKFCVYAWRYFIVCGRKINYIWQKFIIVARCWQMIANLILYEIEQLNGSFSLKLKICQDESSDWRKFLVLKRLCMEINLLF